MKLELEKQTPKDHCNIENMIYWLVVEPTPLKNISQIGSFPQVGMKKTNISNHHLDDFHVNKNTTTSGNIDDFDVSCCHHTMKPSCINTIPPEILHHVVH